MGSLAALMSSLGAENDPEMGDVEQMDDHRWIVGHPDQFPVQIEKLENDSQFLIYATALRETSEPVYLPLMITLFIEGLNGHSLGGYGICPGPVTLSLFQKVQFDAQYSTDRLIALIACHRLLIECFLEAGYDRHDDITLISDEGKRDQPILPFRH